jgi:hypothetical protein
MRNIEELLRDEERSIVAEVAPTVGALEHYRRDGDESTRRRVEALYRHVARAVRARDLDDLLAHAARVARERFESGYARAEVDAAFRTLEGAISRQALARLPLEELAWGLGLVSTAMAHARSEVSRTFESLTPAARPGTVDLTAVFRRSRPGGRAAEELVFPV